MNKLKSEFLSFINKGSVIDVAVGIMIGTSFQRIVSSLVNHVFMPLISWLFNNDFSTWFLTLQAGIPAVESEAGLIVPPSGWITPPIRLSYGLLIQSIVDFFLIALLLFFILKAIRFSEKIRGKLIKDLSLKKETSTNPNQDASV